MSRTLRGIVAASLLAMAMTQPASGEPALQQYRSGGHVLGFAADGYFASNGTYALRVTFEGAQPVAPSADDAGTAAPNAKAPELVRVTYPGLWAGIDVTYDRPGSGIARSTWSLEPGADPAAIRLRYNGTVTVTDAGELSIRFETGAMRESRPIAWQEVDGRRQPVDVAFAPQAENLVGFRVAAYRTDLPLTIDPTLTWSTFLGGSSADSGSAIAVDGGNVYVAGESSADWGDPLRAYTSRRDVFVAKLNSDGALGWHTFLGGSGDDRSSAIALDSGGNVYVAGSSDASWGSPLRHYVGRSDAFVAKLTPAGAATWSTFLGSGGDDNIHAIAVDGGGNVYVAGSSELTWGSPVREHESFSLDAFAAKLTPAGNLKWNTFLGGHGSDGAEGIAVDRDANVYVAGGSTAAWGSPLSAYVGGNDAYAAKLTSTGALTWHTFLGGAGIDEGSAVAVDGSGNVYVAGSSKATWGVPVRAYTADHDGFAAKLTPAGSLKWNTFLGGPGPDFGTAIAVDGGGNVYVQGASTATWDSPVRAYSGYHDAFAARLTSAGALTWNTFLGGDYEDLGSAIAVDGSGHVYVAGSSLLGWGSPVRAYSGDDAVVAKLDPAGGLTWNTFLGRDGKDNGEAIAVDRDGNVYVTGSSNATWGSPLRAYSPGLGDAFVAKLDSAGALLWNTFLGSIWFDAGGGIAVDGSGNVYVTGTSLGTWGTPPRAHAGGVDAFVARLDSAGALVWNTFLGGTGFDHGRAIRVDGNGRIYIGGTSYAAWGTPVRAHAGGSDAFVARLTPAGSLTWNTFLGGAGYDSGAAIALREYLFGGSIVYVAGKSATTWGTPVRAYAGGPDAFAAMLNADGGLSWNTFLGGASDDDASAIAVDESGNAYIAGTSWTTWGAPVRAFSDLSDAFAAKLTSDGALAWNTFIGSDGPDESAAIAVDGSGSVFIGESSRATWGDPIRAFGGEADSVVVKLASDGALTWNTFLGGSGEDWLHGLAMGPGGSVCLTGTSTATWGSPVRDFPLVRAPFVAQIPADNPPTRTPTTTSTSTPTWTGTRTPTSTPTRTATDLPTKTATNTRTLTPATTSTATWTVTPTVPSTQTATGTASPSQSPAVTATVIVTSTLTTSPTATPTPSATPAFCAGDCNRDRLVTVDEVVALMTIALGHEAVTACPNGDADDSGSVTIAELVTAVRAALEGCGPRLPAVVSGVRRSEP